MGDFRALHFGNRFLRYQQSILRYRSSQPDAAKLPRPPALRVGNRRPGSGSGLQITARSAIMMLPF
jgi:hypothetical protein